MDAKYSLDELRAFYTMVGDSGLMQKNTAQSLKSAAVKILSVLQKEEVLDLRNVDLDKTFIQFQNRFKTEYSPVSLRIYESRSKGAVKDFIKWVDDPISWTPKTAAKNLNGPSKNVFNTETSQNFAPGKTQHITMSSDSTETIQIPIPLRPGVLLWVQGVPLDLTAKEADKITAVIAAYANP